MSKKPVIKGLSIVVIVVIGLFATATAAMAGTPKLQSGTDYHDRYKVGTFPSHFDMEVWATATDDLLTLRNWTFGKAWRVLWVRWGNVDITTVTKITCDSACNISTSTTGPSQRTESIVTTAISRAEKPAGATVTIVAAASSALSATGGPTVTVGAAPLTVGFTWPSSTYSNTLPWLPPRPRCCR